MFPVTSPPATATASSHAVRDALDSTRRWLFGKDGLSFRDLLDLVNPLQHIPGVSQLYRKLTGDEIKPAMALAGGALFGGPIGAGLAAAGLAVEAGASAVVVKIDTAPALVQSAPRGGGWKLNTSLAAAESRRLAGTSARYHPDTAVTAGDLPAAISHRSSLMLAAALAQLDASRQGSQLRETA